VKSGQLTAGETANLETKEAASTAKPSADRAANGGKLTAGEKKQINAAAKPAFKPDFIRQAQRQHGALRQQQSRAAPAKISKTRIAQRHQERGQLTAGETPSSRSAKASTTGCRGPQGHGGTADGF